MTSTESTWNIEETAAETLVPLIGKLYRERAVEVAVFGRLLNKGSVSDIIRAHESARKVEGATITSADTLRYVQTLAELPVVRAHVDIGKLKNLAGDSVSDDAIRETLNRELADAFGDVAEAGRQPEQKDVVLYGFGRIGRIVARLLCSHTSSTHRTKLRAIVVRRGKGNDLEKRASLLSNDSVHGPYNGVVEVDADNQCLIISGHRVQVIYADRPEDADYKSYGISNAVLVDNTGVWRDEDGLSRHLVSGAISQVLLTAPGKGAIKNIVHGINNDIISDDDRILSAASCTTNAIAPVLKAIHSEYSIVSGHMETVHSYTNDQNLIDNYHGANRRGRGAPLNMVLTETGATKAVAKALPELEGKITGSSIRVPTPNVSLAVLSLNIEGNPTRDELNEYLHQVSLNSALQKQVGYSTAPDAVSMDFVGTRSTGVVDSLATQVAPNRCVVYVWYDNEFGYTCQVVRVLRQITHSTLPAYPSSSN